MMIILKLSCLFTSAMERDGKGLESHGVVKMNKWTNFLLKLQLHFNVKTFVYKSLYTVKKPMPSLRYKDCNLFN